MTDRPDLTKPKLSSLVVPSDDDLAVWQAMTPAEQKAALLEKADRAAASPARSMTADEFIAEAKAKLRHGSV